MRVLQLDQYIEHTPPGINQVCWTDSQFLTLRLAYVVAVEKVKVEGEHKVAQPVHILFYQFAACRVPNCHVAWLWPSHHPGLAPFLHPSEVRVKC